MRNTFIFKPLIFLVLAAASTLINAAPVLNGLAVHSELGKEQFIAGLSVTTLSNSSRDILIVNEPKQIQVRVLIDRLSSRRFKRMWIEGMAINASSSELSEHAKHMAKFSNMLKMKLSAGDIFTIDRGSDQVNVYLNGVKLGDVPDVAFFDLLLRTWIGPVPLSSQFRDNLLVAGDIDNALLSRFDATFPSEDRIAEVEANVTNQEKSEPQVAAIVETPEPAIDATIAAPALGAGAIATAPKVAAPEVAAPGLPASTTTKPKPTPPPVAAATPKPTPKPTAAPQQQALLDADALEEEEDLDFTAESLLEQQLYIAKLKRYSYNYLSYPRRALDRGWEGNVRLNITIDRTGKVLEVVVVEESEYKTLTKEAVNAANKASPFPAMPDGLRGETFAFTLPVVFKIRSN